MDRETTLKLARKANLLFPGVDRVDGSIEQLETFFKLAAEHGASVEREACAELCHWVVAEPGADAETALRCVEEIRARGNNA